VAGWRRDRAVGTTALPGGLRCGLAAGAAQAIPCHSCYNFCTTPEFLPQFQKIREETLELIQIGEEAGRAQWVERNRQNLAPVEQIIALLEGGKLHHPAGKARREDAPLAEAADGA
jgi:hypothetical protein